MRNEVSPGLSRAAERCSDALASEGLLSLARVIASERAVDLAIMGADSGDLVVRCVSIPSVGDYRALATMVTEGDFRRAFLVHTGDETDLTGEIQTWPLSRIDELAALLAKESPP